MSELHGSRMAAPSSVPTLSPGATLVMLGEMGSQLHYHMYLHRSANCLCNLPMQLSQGEKDTPPS